MFESPIFSQSAPDQIIARAQSRFNMKIDEHNLEFVYLHRRRWVEAEMSPYLTLLGQSLGSVWLGKDCCICHIISLQIGRLQPWASPVIFQGRGVGFGMCVLWLFLIEDNVQWTISKMINVRIERQSPIFFITHLNHFVNLKSNSSLFSRWSHNFIKWTLPSNTGK